MNTISSIVMWDDLIKLPKSHLVDICIGLGINSKGTVSDLSSLIWETINHKYNSLSSILSSYDAYLLGGKTSVTWYTLGTTNLLWLKDAIISQCDSNPFETLKIIERNENIKEPTIISAAKGNNNGDIILRYQMIVGNQRYAYGGKVEYLPRTTLVTVFYNEYNRYLEIRTKPEYAQKVARALARCVKKEISLNQFDIMSFFGNDVERIAIALNGKLTDTTAKPDVELDAFTAEESTAVTEILKALDIYFVSDDPDDFDQLKDTLEETKSVLGEGYVNIPFTACLINGMDTIGMKAPSDLRGLPLYDYLTPHVRQQGGYIRFPVDEQNGVTEHTIRVGVTTKSIQFVTISTEEAIKYVRDKLLH